MRPCGSSGSVAALAQFPDGDGRDKHLREDPELPHGLIVPLKTQEIEAQIEEKRHVAPPLP